MMTTRNRAEFEARYGRMLIDSDPRGGYRIISPLGWETANMTKVVSALLPAGKLYVHKDMAGPLLLALAAARTTCHDYTIRTIGCWNVRYKRTATKEVSLHSYGLAVDINADKNPLSVQLVTDMPPTFVQAFKDQGFTWGGEFSGMKDAMHYQLAAGI